MSKKHPLDEQWVVGPKGKEMSLRDLMKTYPKNAVRHHSSNVVDPAVNKLYGIKKGSGKMNVSGFEGDTFVSVDGTFNVRVVVPKETYQYI